MKIISDTHVHSTFSFDAKNSIEDMVKAALNQDLKVIGFTEHVDFNINDGGADYYDYEGYSSAIERVRDRYGDEIHILKGIEFSEPHLYPREFERELSREYDMVMVGLHWFDNLFYGNPNLLTKYDKERIFERYFNDLREMVQVGRFDVLAHFDLPTRYLGDWEVATEVLTPIVETLVENQISLEINSSKFRNGFKSTMPHREVLELFINLGGERVTFGSDAHSIEVIGADFEESVNYLGTTLESLDYGVFKNRTFLSL